MAYTKKTWEDFPNTSTPITADDLNNIEDGIEVLNDKVTNHIMTAYTTGRPTLNVPKAYAAVKIPLGGSVSTGTKLTFNDANDRIIVGAGVSKVKISANLVIFTSPSYNNASLMIEKNNATVVESASEKTGVMTNYSITNFLMSVSENDYIEYHWTANAVGDYTVISDSIRCYLTVEVIE